MSLHKRPTIIEPHYEINYKIATPYLMYVDEDDNGWPRKRIVAVLDYDGMLQAMYQLICYDQTFCARTQRKISRLKYNIKTKYKKIMGRR